MYISATGGASLTTFARRLAAESSAKSVHAHVRTKLLREDLFQHVGWEVAVAALEGLARILW